MGKGIHLSIYNPCSYLYGTYNDKANKNSILFSFCLLYMSKRSEKFKQKKSPKI